MKYILLAALSLSVSPFVLAQSGQGNPNADDSDNGVEESDGHRRFWQASLPGGHYMVALDRISSMSMHQYVLDGGLIVNEMTVDTNGRSLARFYHIEPVKASGDGGGAARVVERGQELLDRAGQRTGLAVHDMVQKNYPNTTHAGMVEYRLQNLASLEALYQSLRRAWERGRGRSVTVE